MSRFIQDVSPRTYQSHWREGYVHVYVFETRLKARLRGFLQLLKQPASLRASRPHQLEHHLCFVHERFASNDLDVETLLERSEVFESEVDQRAEKQ